MRTKLEIALAYLKFGMSVIPIQPTIDKHPAIDWKEFQTRKATEDEIRAWWTANPNYNIGIVTGKISGITVVDFDVKKDENKKPILVDGKPELKSTRIRDFPITTAVTTWSGGAQYYYKYTDKITQGADMFKDGSGVDIRNDGGYVLTVGSEIEGKPYTKLGTANFAEFPYHLFSIVPMQKVGFDLGSVIEGIGQGSRNETAAQIAGKFIQKFPEDLQMAFELTSLWNTKNTPPLSEKELRTVFLSIMKKDKSRPQQNIEKQIVDLKSSFSIVTLTDLVKRSMEELDATNPEDCVSFGYEWLDDKLTGLFPGELLVLGGESGTGKTTFATNIIYKASKKNKAAILALEDRLNDYGIKAIYFELGRVRKELNLPNYPWNEYRKNNINDKAYKTYRAEAEKRVRNDNVLWVEVKQQMSIELLEVVIDEMVKTGTELFLIDHLHYFDLLKSSNSKADYIESVMVRLKTLQNRNGARVIMIAHYKKLDGKKPTLDSFKDGASIFQNANYVINLWRDRTDGGDRLTTKLMISKSRNPNGEANIDVKYNPETNDYYCDEYELQKSLNQSDKVWRFGGTENDSNNVGQIEAI
jgi:replicative DNA helicase